MTANSPNFFDRSRLVSIALGALVVLLAVAFRGPEGHFGVLDPALLRRWAAWEARFGIVRAVPDVAATFDAAFAPTARGSS